MNINLTGIYIFDHYSIEIIVGRENEIEYLIRKREAY